MKVLFVSPTPRAGTAQYTHNLANALAERGHEVVLVSSVGYELRDYPRSYDLVELFDRFKPRVRAWLRLAKRLRSLRPQIVHFQGAQRPLVYFISLLIIKAQVRAKFVYTPQDILPFTDRPLDRFALKRLYANMSHIFFNATQNAGVAQELFGAKLAHTTALAMPDLMAFMRDQPQPQNPHASDVLLFGQIQERKGVNVLIDASAQMVSERPGLKVVVVGQPHMDIATLNQQIERLGLSENVEIRPGYVSFNEMDRWFTGARIIALPYVMGWNSGVLASAFGYSKPVVASTIGGLDESVVDGVNGLLVPPNDANSLARALLRLLRDSALYTRVVSGAVESANKTSWKVIASQTEQVYEQLV